MQFSGAEDVSGHTAPQTGVYIIVFVRTQFWSQGVVCIIAVHSCPHTAVSVVENVQEAPQGVTWRNLCLVHLVQGDHAPHCPAAHVGHFRLTDFVAAHCDLAQLGLGFNDAVPI